MHTRGSVDCLHCLISTTAQNQERKESLFATTIFLGYKKGLITDQLSFYMANEHRRKYFTNMISNCNVAYVNGK